ncbi:MAG: hypothetical protein HKN79_05480 [Flavobacteriales bacterium]|nr:hypothetical protein [Flavobacteriales bacterium]
MKLFYTISFLLATVLMYGQEVSPDPRLNERFSQEQLEKMSDDRIIYWNYYLDHSFQIMAMAEEKVPYLIDLETVSIDPESFHGFTMELDSYHREGAYLKIEGHQQMLVVKSMKQFIQEFNAYYQSLKK